MPFKVTYIEYIYIYSYSRLYIGLAKNLDFSVTYSITKHILTYIYVCVCVCVYIYVRIYIFIHIKSQDYCVID